MSGVLTTRGAAEIVAEVVARGDLGRLTPEQKARYYLTVCESIGLNPYTTPFDYLVLNGKTVLYAKKGATDQLRGIHGISIVRIEREMIDDLYVVSVAARDRSGRVDEEIGAVAIAGLKGEAKANAMMKALTKAKRRVTLSLVGLGMLDESEVEAVPGARVVPVSVDQLPPMPTRTETEMEQAGPPDRAPAGVVDGVVVDVETAPDDAPITDRARRELPGVEMARQVWLGHIGRAADAKRLDAIAVSLDRAGLLNDDVLSEALSKRSSELLAERSTS